MLYSAGEGQDCPLLHPVFYLNLFPCGLHYLSADNSQDLLCFLLLVYSPLSRFFPLSFEITFLYYSRFSLFFIIIIIIIIIIEYK
jgi:hypothetical protein